MKTVTNIPVIFAFCVFLFESSVLGKVVYPEVEQPAHMPIELPTTELIAESLPFAILGAACGTGIGWCASFCWYLITQKPFDLDALSSAALMVGLFGAGIGLGGRLTELQNWMTS
jgi:lysylphosphatidylglycerol synthetase-like protein (DUF2156 family)